MQFMSYFSWFVEHDQKHRHIIQKLKEQGLSQNEIIHYFIFENMVEKEPDFCLLYANKQKCHKLKYLNCYMCACPHFRFNDEGIEQKEGVLVKSLCSIDSKKASRFMYEGVEHLDCSKCSVPHTKAFIQKHFDEAWHKIMKSCVTFPKG